MGYCVGWCCANRSSFSMCIRVVLPALSRPCMPQWCVSTTSRQRNAKHAWAHPEADNHTRKRILAFLLYKPSELSTE